MNNIIHKTMHNVIKLRAHHLLCMISWKGVGYTPAFTINYNKIIERLKTETITIEVIKGKDDICAPLNAENYDDYHCDNESVLIRDEKALIDINHHLGLNLYNGSQFEISQSYLIEMRKKFQTFEIRSACVGCDWYQFCSNIAKDDFKDTKILP